MSKRKGAKKDDEAELQSFPASKPSSKRRDEDPIIEEPDLPKKGKGLMNLGGPSKGLLDNHYDDGDIEEGPRRRKSQVKGNQDLWLLYLLFKAISLLW
jgi:hypothetical protein